MTKFSKELKEYAMKIINCKKYCIVNKKNVNNKKNCTICKEELEDTDSKSYHRVRDHCLYTRKYRGAARNVCNLRYKISKKFCTYSQWIKPIS